MRNATLSIMLLLAICAVEARAAEGLVAVKADDLAASIDGTDARLTSLAVRGHELLAAPGELLVEIDGAEPVAVAKLDGFKVTGPNDRLTVEGHLPGSDVSVRVEWRGGRDLECRLRLLSSKGPRREAAVELRLPCRKQTLNSLS